MRTTTAASNPWGNTIDDGWKDLVVSSAPPPPPREALEPVAKNRPLPADFNTWQEHGSARAGAIVAPVDEPSFTAGDRRLWVIAGTLMTLATLVLGVLGMLTFGHGATLVVPAIEAPRTAVVEPTHGAASARAVESNRASSVATAKSAANNPRALKASSRTKHGRHHKRLAAR